MTKFLATPLAMTTEFFSKTAGYGDVGTPQDYTERQTVAVDAEAVDEVLNIVWERFQNIEAPRMCPDGGRSLMVGDIIRVTNEFGEESGLHKVAYFGFEEVRSLKSIFPHTVAALNGEYDDMSYAEIASEQADVDASE